MTTLNTHTIHRLFEIQAKETPDAIAVEYAGRRYTYAELNIAANKLAHHLRFAASIQPDDLVALVVDRSERMVIAMLAILKSGAAYVPIDPAYPTTAIDQILADAHAKAVLFDARHSSRVAAFGGEMFILDIQLKSLATATDDPTTAVNDGNLAYTIYTSGTTGTPKGVAVEHRSIANTVIWRNSYYNFGSGDVVLQVPPYSFDSSVEDIFCMLLSGGTLLIPDARRITDVHYLMELIATKDVSHFLITPALYKRLVRTLSCDKAPALRTIAVAGECFPTRLVKEHYSRLPHVKLFNEYGPAENSVCSTIHPLDPSDDVVLIGKPIPNTTAYVVDRDMQRVELYGKGELCLAGAGLARGYLNQPELTHKAFIRNPFSHDDHDRLYMTGDIVQLLDDGNLRFLGRRDNQVKIGGKRVELDHVTHHVLQHPDVEDAVVLCHVDPAENKRLLAFVVQRCELDVDQLRETLRNSLPAYMVPHDFIEVEQIPITPHGKIDHKALFRAYAESTGDADRAPTAIEETLLKIWRRVLKTPDIGLNDDFFRAGGDSLGAMDVATAVGLEVGVLIEAPDLTVYPTVSRLAEKIEFEKSARTAGSIGCQPNTAIRSSSFEPDL